jgi:AcrR family transcriptional regulator
VGRAGLDKRAVVAAAAQLADEAGWEGVGLRALAERLGVKAPSLYNHVDGLPALRRELAVEAAHQLAQRFADAAVGRATDDALRRVAHAYRAFAHEHPGLYPGVLAAPDPSDEEWLAAAAAIVRILTAVLSGYGLSANDALHAVRALRAALHGFVSLEAQGGFGLPLSLDDSYARLIETLLAGLRRPRR